jgi:acyl-CoA synthetase (AMP-forming)/AMP-acid ligase II
MSAWAGAWVMTRKRASGSTSAVPATSTSAPACIPCSPASRPITPLAEPVCPTWPLIEVTGSSADATVGYSILGCEIAILDPEGNPVAPGEQGEVAVKPLAHFSGYLNRPDTTAAAWAGDFLRSDDIGVLEKDGRLRIIDRGNGLIISGGETVYAAEVERVLISHPQVRDVSGKPDPRWGEVVVAVVVPKPGTSPTPPSVSCGSPPRTRTSRPG